MQTSKGMTVVATCKALVRLRRSSVFLESDCAMSLRFKFGDFGQEVVERKL